MLAWLLKSLKTNPSPNEEDKDPKKFYDTWFAPFFSEKFVHDNNNSKWKITLMGAEKLRHMGRLCCNLFLCNF
jgi:hypothetical protein